MSQPLGTWRYRTNIKHTQKEGYGVGEVTLEFTELTPNSASYDDMSKEYKIRLEQLIEDGEEVARQKNHDHEDANKWSK